MSSIQLTAKQLVKIVFRFGLMIGCGALSLGCSSEPPRRAVILITLDTARGDLFDWTNPAEFPNIKSLFADGLRFDQAITSSPVTGPAHASLFTGLPANAHGVLSNHFSLDEEQTTLAERLSALGYRTGGFVSCSVLGAGRGFDQGFDHFDSNFDAAYASGHYERAAGATTSRALTWLGNNSDQPFFLWVHYLDAHAPYAPPAGFHPDGFDDLVANSGVQPTISLLRKIYQTQTPVPDRIHDYYRALYRGQLEFVDTQVARIQDFVERHGDPREVTYILTADHGEELGDHMNFFEHNLSLYDGVLRVPLAIRSPGLSSTVVSEQVDPASIMATVLEIVGQTRAAEIAPSLLNDTGRARTRVATKELHPAVRPWGAVLRAPPWKYFYWEDGTEELYHLDSDPGERRDVSAEQLERTKAMRTRIKDEVLPKYATPEIEARLRVDTSPKIFEMLRALGYAE